MKCTAIEDRRPKFLRRLIGRQMGTFLWLSITGTFFLNECIHLPPADAAAELPAPAHKGQ